MLLRNDLTTRINDRCAGIPVGRYCPYQVYYSHKEPNTMTQSILTKYQKKTVSKLFTENKVQKRITVELRYDDECNNGHNSFTLTTEIRLKDRRIRDCEAYGCIHDEISKHFPELQKYIKWHLCSSEGPLHYIANTLWHARDSESRNLDAARRCAIWPEATDDELTSPNLRQLLEARLPKLLEEFQADMQELGFTF